MTPEMIRALRQKFRHRTVRAVDALFLDRDPFAKQLMVMMVTQDNIYAYHIPQWEVLSIIWAMLRHLGWSGVLELFYLKALRVKREQSSE